MPMCTGMTAKESEAIGLSNSGCFLDQINFPSPVPFLDLLFACYRGEHVAMKLVINQIVYSITFGESLSLIVFVFPDSFYEIAGHADI